MGLKIGLSKLFGRNKDGGAENRPTLDGAHPEYKTYEGVNINLLDKIKKGDLTELQRIETQLKNRAKEILSYCVTYQERELAEIEKKFVQSIKESTKLAVMSETEKLLMRESTKKKINERAQPILDRLQNIFSSLEDFIQKYDGRKNREREEKEKQAAIEREFKEKTGATIDYFDIKLVFDDSSKVNLVPSGMDPGLVKPVLAKAGEGLNLTIDYQSGKNLQIEIIADRYTAKLTDSTGAIKEQNYEGSVADLKYNLKNIVGDVNLRPGEDRLARLMREADTKKAEAWAAAKKSFEMAANATVDEVGKVLILPGGEVLPLTATDLPHTQVQYKEIDGKQCLQVAYGALHAGGVIYPLSSDIFPPQRAGENFQIRSNVERLERVSVSLAELGEYLHKKAESASVLINEKETEFTEDEVEDITPKSDVPPELPPELPVTDTTDSGATHSDIPVVTTAQLDDNAATDPELPAVTQADLTDPADNHEAESTNVKQVLESLQGIRGYDESSGILSFEDSTVQSIDLADVPDGLSLKPELRISSPDSRPNFWICFDYVKKDHESEGEYASLAILYNADKSIKKISATNVELDDRNIKIDSTTTSPLSEINDIFSKFKLALEKDLNPEKVTEPESVLASVPEVVPVQLTAAEEIKQLKAELEKLKAEKASLEKEKKVSNLPDYLKAEMEDWNKLITQSYTDKKEAAASKHAHGHHTSTHHDQSGHGHAEHGSAKSGHADHAAGDHGKPHGKTHEKPHAPETIKNQELVFDHDTLYFKGKKIDFAVKGFKVSVVEKVKEPKLGQTIWLVPKHSDKEDHATDALGIALTTDPESTIIGVRLLKEVVPDESDAEHILTVVHAQETSVSNPEALVGLLKSVASYIEINKPLGELPKPPVKPDDREPDHGHGGHSDTHHDSHHSSGGGHGHGHDAPKQPELKSTPKPKAPAFPKWQEVEFGKQPVLDISSDFFFSFLQKEQDQESIMGKQVMDIYKKMVDSKADLVAEFANIFDDLPLTAELDEALEKQGITFEDFKEHWKKSYHQEVYAIFKKAALADQATERNLRTTQLDKIGGVQGYAKKAVLRGGIMITGASLGEGLIDEYAVDLDQFAPEVKGMVYGGLAQLTDKWLGSWWKKAAKWVGSVGEEDIANRKKTGIKRQSQELVKDLNNQSFYEYKMKSMAKWLSQGIRAASVKNAQSHENIDAHLGATDDPNLYVLRIEAAKALRVEFHEQGNEVGERLATLDAYVNSLNQAHFDSSRKKTEIQSKYQKPSLTEDSAGMKMLKTAGKIYDWAETKIKVLNGFTGAAAGVALWATSLPFRRLIWATLAAAKGSEIGNNADKQALKTRQEKEVNALLLETRKVLDSYREGVSGYLRRPDTKKVSSKKLRPNFNETFDNANIEAVIQALAKLEAVLALGVLNPALELEVQDTVHTIRKGVFFENNGDNRTFKLDLLEKETKGYGAIAEQEIKRLTERPWKWRKYLGFLAGAAAGKTFGSILGFGGK